MTVTTAVSLPESFQSLLVELLEGPILERARASFAQEKPTSLRVNTLKTSVADARSSLAHAGLSPTSVAWLDIAMTVAPSERRALTESPLVAEGAIYLQSLSSMLAPLALDPQPGEEVLDLAAAPGGKTLMMAAQMGGRGRIAAVEPVRDRFFRLKGNVERAGAGLVRLYPHDGITVGGRVPERFDRVLLDAPCSSQARFTELDPRSFARYRPKKVQESARKQRALIRSAFTALKPGGRMAYCTCSLSPEENELVVASLLEREPSAFIDPWRAPIDEVMQGLREWRGQTLPPELAGAVRVLPTESMDAFFLCLIGKRDHGSTCTDGQARAT